jgi:NO-binding membrane sensor protein with MHYT domain
MQTVWASLYKITSSKAKLLAVITAVVIAVMAVPVILPHITDTSIIYHLLLHVISLIIAIFLGFVSILAYLRNGNSRLLFMMFGFLLLSVIEAIYLFHITSNVKFNYINITGQCNAKESQMSFTSVDGKKGTFNGTIVCNALR